MTTANKRYIKEVCAIVNDIEDAEAAYDAAMDLLNEWVETVSDMDIELVRLIEQHLEKGDHPAEGMIGIYTHPMVR